ncbi:MAG: glycosyltransferase [Rhodopila sp.]|nr:glycosyltransferase [Rhodopila sp.]
MAILLSTFNGERYLHEQLASFTAQTHANWRLYWRDDGSSDRTPALMADYAGGQGAGRFVACPEGGRMRATGSFLALLRVALQGPTAFFAFSDQDDVWLPEKLAHGVAALGHLPPERPALYFCGRALVDSTLAPVGQVLAPRRPPGFPSALTQNLAPGCCMMLNRAAAELIDASTVPEGAFHDWWAYVVVSANGGSVIAGDTPDILYRQHSNNLVGEPRGFWHRTAGAARRGRGPFMTLFWRQVAALQAGPVPLPDTTRAFLSAIEQANHSGLFARLKALRLPGFVRQTWAETLLFRLWFLLG